MTKAKLTVEFAHRWRCAALGLSIAAGALTMVSSPSEARAGDSCTTVADTSSKVWGETPKVVKDAIATSGPFGATAMKAAKLIEEGVKIWNRLASDKSWAKIGPRRLDFGEWNTGTLIGPTERKFLSGIPAVNPVKVDVHKLDHDGKVRVVVCKVPNKGKAKVVDAFDIPAGAPKGKVKTVEIPGAKGNLITVVLHGKSVGKKLQYKVRARFDFEEESDAEHTVSGSRTGGTTVSGAR